MLLNICFFQQIQLIKNQSKSGQETMNWHEQTYIELHIIFCLKTKTLQPLSIINTRKRALHAKMSHSTVCNTTVSTKLTHRTLVKYVRTLRVTPHACKEIAPVNVKEKHVFVQAIKRGHGYRCVYVFVIINQISSKQLLVCVCVCNGSAPGYPIRDAPQMCGVCVCVRHHHSPVDSYLCVYV